MVYIKRKAPSESATKFKVGTMKTGNDGDIWTVMETSNGVQRWVKHKFIEKFFNRLYNKFWHKLSTGYQLIIYKDNSYKMQKSVKNNNTNNTVKKIVWTSRSTDSLTFFIHYIINSKNITVNDLNSLYADPVKELAENSNKYLTKYELNSDKDYTLKNSIKLNQKMLLNKINQINK